MQGTVTAIRICPYIVNSGKAPPTGFLESLGYSSIRRSPYYDHTVMIDILESEEEQWRQLRRSTRTAINKGKRLGLSVSTASDLTSFTRFSDHYSAFAEKREIAPLSAERIVNIHNAFKGRAMHRPYLVSAKLKNETLGQALMMPGIGSLIYEWGWTRSDSNATSIPVTHSLIWQAIQWCRQSGIQALDLGGYWIERGSNDSINFFKTGFSKNIVGCGNTYECPLDNLSYRSHRLLSHLISLPKTFLRKE